MDGYLVGFFVLLAVCAGLSHVFRETGHSSSKDGKDDAQKGALSTADREPYLRFRNNYLLVYMCMMMSDWLQGPYVYPLYKKYGFTLDEIGVLFVVGFLSSAVFGTVISSFADQHGRKKLCLAFCVLYTMSCFTKLSPSYGVLLFGRFLGGISTSLLFSVFEAWMVSEHHSRGFREELLADTFSWATYLNGIVAIGSGLAANALVDATESFVAPFMLSACFLVVGGVFVGMTWTENYGKKEDSNSAQQDGSSSLVKGIQVVLGDWTILYVGTIVALFEGSMYTFVFMWGPILEQGDAKVPYGWVFAAFMVCIMIGSIFFRVALSKNISVATLTPYILGAGTLSFVIPIVSKNAYWNYWAFNLFETCCGVYFPTLGTLRSRYVPEETRATVMNIFRIPLNLIVVLLLTRASLWSNSVIFTVLTGLLTAATVCSVLLVRRIQLQGGPLYAKMKDSDANVVEVEVEEVGVYGH